MLVKKQITIFPRLTVEPSAVQTKMLRCNHHHRHLPPPVAGVSEQAGRLSSGSLRAHAELLEQRLQAPPILPPHPLLPDRGCHEHGVETEERRGSGECLGFNQKKKKKEILSVCLPGGGDVGGARGVATPGLRPLVRSDKPL